MINLMHVGYVSHYKISGEVVQQTGHAASKFIITSFNANLLYDK